MKHSRRCAGGHSLGDVILWPSVLLRAAWQWVSVIVSPACNFIARPCPSRGRSDFHRSHHAVAPVYAVAFLTLAHSDTQPGSCPAV